MGLGAPVPTTTETGLTPGSFTVTRTGSTAAQALTVFFTVGGVATAGVDYVTLPGSVVIPAGQTSSSLTLTPIDDGLVEGAETVIVTLSANAAYVVGSPSAATVTITDDDTLPLDDDGDGVPNNADQCPGTPAGQPVNANGCAASQPLYTVTLAGAGSGTVTSTPAGIDCGADCVEVYAPGTIVTLVPLAAAGSSFAGWSGACTGTGLCILIVSADLAVTATFEPVANPATRPRVTAPANGLQLTLATPMDLIFTWTAVTGAVQYGFEFTGPDRKFANRNGNGADPVNGFGGPGGGFLVPITSLTVRLVPGLPDGVYEVRVIGLDATGQVVGTFSDALTLAINTVLTPANGRPTITTPASGTPLPAGTLARFTWTGVVGVAQYLFEFTGPNRDFATPNGTTPDPGALGSVIVAGTVFEVPIPPGVAPGTYRVRVIARTQAGQPIGTFSDAVPVTIP